MHTYTPGDDKLISKHHKTNMHTSTTAKADAAIGTGRTRFQQQHQVSTQESAYLDQVHRLMSASDSQLDPFKLLQDVILPQPLVWSQFVQNFVFEDLGRLKEMLAGYACKHIILRCTQN